MRVYTRNATPCHSARFPINSARLAKEAHWSRICGATHRREYLAPESSSSVRRVRDRFVRFLPLFRHSFSSESDFPTDRKGRDGNRRRSLNRKRVPRDDGDDGGRLSMVAPISAAGRI